MRQLSDWFVKDGQLGTGHIDRNGQLVDFRAAKLSALRTLSETIELIMNRVDNPFRAGPTRALGDSVEELTAERACGLTIGATPAKGVWLDDGKVERRLTVNGELQACFEPEYAVEILERPVGEIFLPAAIDRLNTLLTDRHFVTTTLGLPPASALKKPVTVTALPATVEILYAVDPTYKLGNAVFHILEGRFYRGLSGDSMEAVIDALREHLVAFDAADAEKKTLRAKSLKQKRHDSKVTHELQRCELAILRSVEQLLRNRQSKRWLQRWATLGTASNEVESLFAPAFSEIATLLASLHDKTFDRFSTTLNSKLGRKIKTIVLAEIQKERESRKR